jgi:hypothetical protein
LPFAVSQFVQFVHRDVGRESKHVVEIGDESLCGKSKQDRAHEIEGKEVDVEGACLVVVRFARREQMGNEPSDFHNAWARFKNL